MSRRPSLPPGRPSGQEASAGARLTVFAWLFAVAILLFHTQWPINLGGPSWQSLSVLSALAVLVRPSSPILFVFLVLVQTITAWVEMPYIANNRKFLFLVGSSILASIPFAARRTRGSSFGAELVSTFEPLVRLEVVILYAFAFWHKLNHDYLDPSLGCGPAALEPILDGLESLGLGIGDASWLDYPVIYGPLALEGLLVPMLIWRRSRNVAIIAAMAMHWAMGLAWYYSFSGTMLALLFLFAPASTGEDLLRIWRSLSRGPWRALVYGAIAAAGAAVAGTLFLWQTDKPKHWLFWIPVAVLIGLFAGLLRRSGGTVASPRSLIWPRHRLLWLMPALVVFNGLCPYLGLQTKSAFAMYSNLRTEGGRSNHLLIRGSIPLADYQQDLVTIVSSSDPELSRTAASAHLLPFIALRTRVDELRRQGVTGVSVTYVRDGRRREVTDAGSDPELSKPPSYLERKLVRFRVIPTGDNVCTH